jgi:predicted O-methyltransferase YrrM
MVHPGRRHPIAHIVGERQFGVCQFFRDALRGHPADELAFNCQAGRQRLFLDLVRTLAFDEIIETGTFRGDTTAFMSRESGLPVFTCESSPRHYGYARTRFALKRHIRLVFSDSRAFLRSHFGASTHDGRSAFVYLDAHWGDDLPLLEETRILLTASSASVVMIDDFAVPDDPGYAFDSYGPDATLNLEYLQLRDLPDVRSFFPALRSSQETGARRGYVLLARAGPAADALATLHSVRVWDAR